MIERMILKLKSSLPLEIDSLSFDGDFLNFSTREWGFSTLSAWRVIDDNRVVFGCFDKNSKVEIIKLIGQNVIDVGIQSNRITIDPIFFISNHSILEIFSTDIFEPWTLCIEKEDISFYAACPAQPEIFDIKDN